MAFNFNWSPLTADADFYRRARDLLTKALNKSPKPPIIVDDILVSEFNLGTVPPDLEILEIGDLAEDRFRGIFKMTYSGDAFLTLKTRVQANPLNTYLYSKPTFTSPQPLAAASGLTIPLSITLSDFKLSAFIILVFSKQKGLTLVFRNDPLESLKVSSTFDSIQFVRDYLQRTIEQQLRNLMMDELPAIIHRLSLQLWCPDQANKGTETPAEKEDEASVDPLASPPLDPVDANGNLLDPNAISELTLNGSGEVQSLFSQKNLLRLAALTDSHRTLSLFTPGIRDVVFRAWTGYGERSESSTPLLSTPTLTKTMSFHAGNSTTYTFSDTASNAHGHLPSRPSLISMNSATNGRSLGAGRSRTGRKKKTRVVNLRRTKSEVNTPETGSEASDTASVDVPLSEPTIEESIPEETESSIIAEASTPNKVRFRSAGEAGRPLVMATLEEARRLGSPLKNAVQTSEPQDYPSIASITSELKSEKSKSPGLENQSISSETSSVILEQAWIMKMAGEIAKRVYDEKNRQRSPWDEREDAPPPAYEAATQ
ncbi:mitochondrial distribution and morphology protein 34 [Fusarium proliferatum]|uniref:Mitochondrial distribution and morphology protein 34 n=4 Tax=Fusarium fujikuroi species complex TaxID=171627 RepID=A0A8H5YDN6_9HYPO|nr:putative Mitochondrial distribution and morphology protein 34 [Fusarium proliferatum ET1]XP_041679420.1 putative Mitochondrial distribution and morphology protein 34 [Fusarium mangiferae]KAF5655887.1 mitochondrial distribution and morphology 34 [Fusarium sp. NRRL 25303]KAF5709397.1 mitochondrial distribution morphology 34 [Fusarium globosum]KAG4267652.1 mitochondrial distribution and morphology protein 34 [Fusarium proliferatum]KLO89869.1 putative Mitochondrial distribution and morphology p